MAPAAAPPPAPAAEHARPGGAWGAEGGSALRADEAEGNGAGATAGPVVVLGTRRVRQRGSGGAEGGRCLTAGGASPLSVCHAHDPQP